MTGVAIGADDAEGGRVRKRRGKDRREQRNPGGDPEEAPVRGFGLGDRAGAAAHASQEHRSRLPERHL